MISGLFVDLTLKKINKYGTQLRLGKFYKASLILVSGRPIKERLKDAIATSLYHIKDTDLPVEMVEEFRKFIEDVTNVKAVGEEGTIAATINTLSSDASEVLAEKIISMYNTVCIAYATERS